jgi:hypothetical protein
MEIGIDCDTEACPFVFVASVTDDEVRFLTFAIEGEDCPLCGDSVAPCDERFRDALDELLAEERAMEVDRAVTARLEDTVKRALRNYGEERS